MATVPPELGARVLIGPRAATVRYVGTVDGHTGTWVGLEWDDASHGKHSGSVGGRQYFACTSGADAGTLVRAEKFAAAADLGVTVLDALRLRCRPILQYSSGAWRLITNVVATSSCVLLGMRRLDHASYKVCMRLMFQPRTAAHSTSSCLPSTTNYEHQAR
jgi:hypothetical protein